MAETRIVKRYANRKLYDTQRSRYVTLEQIAEMIRSGEDVKIVDNNSKEDLTSITLAQIILEQEKRFGASIPGTPEDGQMAFEASPGANAGKLCRRIRPLRFEETDIRSHDAKSVQLLDHLPTAIVAICQIDDPHLVEQ